MGGKTARALFVCRGCGQESPRWMGRCPGCGEWNSFEERAPSVPRGARRGAPRGQALKLSEAEGEEQARMLTGIGEFDGLLGGGIVPGSFVLIGGEPGIGKSTLMLQVAAGLAGRGERVLYVSAEESFSQTRLRGRRVGAAAEAVFVYCEPNVEAILEEARRIEASVLIVDSIQIVSHPDIPSAPGSVGQVRGSAAAFMEAAKGEGLSVFIVGHVTKSGDIAGPRMLEHMVDTVLYFEGDRHHAYRVLRTRKNRFGSTDEVGIFSMGPGGLEEVKDPSELFLKERRPDCAGSVVTPALEGTRPILVEIQALVGSRAMGIPQRKSLGVDYNRLCVILAVLERRAGLSLRERDVFVSVAGGMTVSEPAADLAVSLALASSLAGRAVPRDLVAVGEVGLGGELRGCGQIERRLKEAAKRGFGRALLPKSAMGDEAVCCGMKPLPCETVQEAIEMVISRKQLSEGD